MDINMKYANRSSTPIPVTSSTEGQTNTILYDEI